MYAVYIQITLSLYRLKPIMAHEINVINKFIKAPPTNVASGPSPLLFQNQRECDLKLTLLLTNENDILSSFLMYEAIYH